MASALRVQVSPSALFSENLDLHPLTPSNDLSELVVLVTNGPGELTTWVRPLAEKLHQKILMQPRAKNSSTALRLVLVPCPNGTGQEKSAAQKWQQFEKINEANQFWDLLLKPKKYGFWPKKGVVVFLGGDQFWSVLLSARLGYRHITYAEWIARWPQWNDRIAAMSLKVKNQIPPRFRERCTIVGDLMADLSAIAKATEPLPEGEWIALLPGSKKSKLSVGVPFLLEVADKLKSIRPNCKFLLPIASTTSIQELQYFNSSKNPIAKVYKSSIKYIYPPKRDCPWSKLITMAGTEIHLQEEQPAHGSLSQCSLALTTVGANTAELGALNVPMIVILPTQHINVMQAWDGLIGIISRLPWMNWCIGFLLSAWRLRNKGFLAWPNISARKMIVPERIGKISPLGIANEAFDWLSSPERLRGQQEDLKRLRGEPGAINALADEVQYLLSKTIQRN